MKGTTLFSNLSTHINPENKWRHLVFPLLLITFLVCVDVGKDIATTLRLKDIFFDISLEFVILSVTFYSLFVVWKKYKSEVQAKLDIEQQLNLTKIKAFEWEKLSQNFIEEFQNRINTQFERWSLSKSEQEIAWMILRGLSAKEMATARHTAERTIRNQCIAVYQKSECQGRNELWAFFFAHLIPENRIKN